MKINWKLRLKNKTTLLALIAALAGVVYQICGIFNIVPPISQDSVVQMLGMIINLFVTLGVVVDPTTSGVLDSERALTYDTPNQNEY